MNTKPDIYLLLGSLNDLITAKLSTSRKAIKHPGTKGDASESNWLGFLQTYLPKRYKATKAFVIDSDGNSSDQIDIVIHDRQYSPLVFKHEDAIYVPAESVYAIFEVKQEASKAHIEYAQKKAASVRSLKRTSLPVPHVDGTSPAKPPQHILSGLLSFESGWNPAMGQPLVDAILLDVEDGRLDLGCIATSGIYELNAKNNLDMTMNDKALTLFLFRLIDLLQKKATVPMIDVMAYAKWLMI